MNKDFIWWTGVVEDRDDPEMLGRCRVRILGYHSKSTTDIPTDELPWAYPAMPINTRPRSTPLGPVEGTWVMGFFKDGESAQQPVMTHVLDSGYQSEDNGGEGFSDPGDDYREEMGYPERPKRNYWPGLTGGFVPFDGTIDEEWPGPDENKINRLAVGETKGTWVNWADERRVTGIETSAPIGLGMGNHTWDEPESDYNAEYPFNKVEESESGHVFEVDDTPGHERITRRHKAGTYEELQNDGRVIKIHGDDYEIIVSNDRDSLTGSKNIYVDGNVNITAGGDINLKTLEGSIRIQSDASIRMKAEEFIVLEAGLGVMNKGMFFSTANGMPLMHGGNSPMVVPSGIDPDVITPDIGLKAKDVSAKLKGITKIAESVEGVSSTIQEGLEDLHNTADELEKTVAEGTRAVEQVKNQAEASVASIEERLEMAEAIKKTTLDWRDKIDEKVDQAAFIQSQLEDPSGSLTMKWEELKKRGQSELESRADAAVAKGRQVVEEKGDLAKDAVLNKLNNQSVQYQKLSQTFSAANQAKEEVRNKLKGTMKKVMQTIGTSILTGTQIAFSVMELATMVRFGRADARDPNDQTPYVVPMGVKSRVVWAGRYVAGNDYVIGDLGTADGNWEQNWKDVMLQSVPLEVGQKFTAKGPGKGSGHAILFFATFDSSVFDRSAEGSLIERAKSGMNQGIPLLSKEEMREIKDKNTLIALIEVFLKPLGTHESEYFQTWLVEADWNSVLKQIAESADGYTNPSDVRIRLREIASDRQRTYLPYILDQRVEGYLHHGTFDDAIESGLHERAAGSQDSNFIEGYNFNNLLDKDDIIQFSNTKRMSGELDDDDYKRLQDLEISFGILPHEVLEVERISVEVGSIDFGRARGSSGGRRRFSNKYGHIWKATGTNNTNLSGFTQAQKNSINKGDKPSSGSNGTNITPTLRLKELKRKLKNTKWGATNRIEKQKLEEQINGLEINISNQRKLDGKPETSEKKNTAEVPTTKKQESNKPTSPRGRKLRPVAGNSVATNRRNR